MLTKKLPRTLLACVLALALLCPVLTGLTASAGAKLSETVTVHTPAEYLDAIERAYTLDSATQAIEKTTTICLANDIVFDDPDDIAALYYGRGAELDPLAEKPYSIMGFNLGYHNSSKLIVRFAAAEGSTERHTLVFACEELPTTPVTISVGTYAELRRAIALVWASGRVSAAPPLVTIALTSDIELGEPTKTLSFMRRETASSTNIGGYIRYYFSDLTNINLRLTSTGDTRRSIVFPQNEKAKLMGCYDASITLDNIILNGSGSSQCAFWLTGRELTINDGTLITGFDTSGSAPVSVINYDSVTMNGGEISNNVGNGGYIYGGGGIALSGGTLTMNGGKICNNAAYTTFGGGAIYVHEDSTVELLDNTTVENNKTLNGGDGGAIYICHTGKLVLANNDIRGNTASGNGGAIYVQGSGKYTGNLLTGSANDGHGAGSMMDFDFCVISGNTAENGGAIYIGGNNFVDGTEYCGAIAHINGGLITQNRALHKGGGIYVESAPEGSYAGDLTMNSGAIYYNVAGENGNESSGAEDAGADLYAEGGNTHISLPTAEEITHYLQDPGSPNVPAQDKGIWFSGWYNDYSDQDPDYGKTDDRIGTDVSTGRYLTSLACDRIAYTPAEKDTGYRALILGKATELKDKESLTVSALPAGTEFRVTQTDAKSSTAASVNGENCIDLTVTTTPKLVADGATNTDWNGAIADCTLSVVNLVNIYRATEDNPIIPSEKPGEPTEPTPPQTPDSNGGAPATGDFFSFELYCALMLLAALGAAALLLCRRRRANR